MPHLLYFINEGKLYELSILKFCIEDCTVDKYRLLRDLYIIIRKDILCIFWEFKEMLIQFWIVKKIFITND